MSLGINHIEWKTNNYYYTSTMIWAYMFYIPFAIVYDSMSVCLCLSKSLEYTVRNIVRRIKMLAWQWRIIIIILT